MKVKVPDGCALYDVIKATIYRSGKQISQAETNAMALANGAKDFKQFIMRYSGQRLVIDEKTLKVKGFVRL